jgi:hypothetical protein
VRENTIPLSSASSFHTPGLLNYAYIPSSFRCIISPFLFCTLSFGNVINRSQPDITRFPPRSALWRKGRTGNNAPPPCNHESRSPLLSYEPGPTGCIRSYLIWSRFPPCRLFYYSCLQPQPNLTKPGTLLLPV